MSCFGTIYLFTLPYCEQVCVPMFIDLHAHIIHFSCCKQHTAEAQCPVLAQDEMKALSWINKVMLLSGYIGFLATWILDIIYALNRKSGVHLANVITQRVLRVLFPHFNLARYTPLIAC